MKRTNDMVCQDILSLLARFKQEQLRLAEEHSLTPVQLIALYMIERHGELAMGKVAHVLHCDPSNVTGIVDRLVSRRLITREESIADRRTKTIALTSAGQKLMNDIRTILPSRLGCDRLTSEEREALHSVAQKIASF